VVGRLSEKPARQDVLDFLARAAAYGNLGLFVGSGFSKAILSDGEEEDTALSWGELLEKAAKRMQVDYASIPKTGLSYSAIASAICAARSERTGERFSTSLRELKNEVARLIRVSQNQVQDRSFSSGGWTRNERSHEGGAQRTE
jgi:hypothetical protein